MTESDKNSITQALLGETGEGGQTPTNPTFAIHPYEAY